MKIFYHQLDALWCCVPICLGDFSSGYLNALGFHSSTLLDLVLFNPPIFFTPGTLTANLQGASLEFVSFNRANLTQANLSEAVLGGADFRGANLSGANLLNAVNSREIDDQDLGARWVEMLKQEVILSSTIMPDGSIISNV